jgi:hypothetical protein
MTVKCKIHKTRDRELIECEIEILEMLRAVEDWRERHESEK